MFTYSALPIERCQSSSSLRTEVMIEASRCRQKLSAARVRTHSQICTAHSSIALTQTTAMAVKQMDCDGVDSDARHFPIIIVVSGTTTDRFGQRISSMRQAPTTTNPSKRNAMHSAGQASRNSHPRGCRSWATVSSFFDIPPGIPGRNTPLQHSR